MVMKILEKLWYSKMCFLGLGRFWKLKNLKVLEKSCKSVRIIKILSQTREVKTKIFIS